MVTKPTPILDRMVRAVQKVRERAERFSAALEAAGIPYAVIGGNAVAYHVATVDEAAVRNTRDVDVLIDRGTLDAVKVAAARAGFRFRHVRGVDCFLEVPDGKFRDAVHLLYAGEKVTDADPVPTPSMDEWQYGEAYRVVSLEALVRMKLVSYRRKDQTHLTDMLDIGLIDASWPNKYAEPLRSRLQAILDDPDG